MLTSSKNGSLTTKWRHTDLQLLKYGTNRFFSFFKVKIKSLINVFFYKLKKLLTFIFAKLSEEPGLPVVSW